MTIVGKVRGKALLVIEKLNSKWVPFHVDVNVFTGGDEECKDWVRDVFSCVDTDTLPAPNAAYKMEVGDRIWVKVCYEAVSTRDYWGEYDDDLYYTKQKVIKRVKAKK